MRRLRQWVALACYVGCVAAMTTACGDDDGSPGDTDAMVPDGGSPDGGPCMGPTRCAVAGSRCSGNTTVTCAADADGCLIETRTTCGGGDVCEVREGAAECVDACASIPTELRCETAGARSCDGDTLRVCEADASGCLVRTDTDCTAAAVGGVCDPEGGAGGDTAVCGVPGDPCAGVTQCGTEPSRTCGDESTITICSMNELGCFVESTLTCDGAGESCGEAGGMSVCRAFGATCDDAIVLGASERRSGDTGFNGGASPTGAGCGSAGSDSVFYAVTVPARSRMVIDVAPTNDSDIVIRALEACGVDACVARVDENGDGEAEELVIVNEGATELRRIVVVDAYDEATTAVYDLTVAVEPFVCGNAVIEPGEACDDGNAADADGCSAACTIEPGYVCERQPSICTPPAANGTCDMARVVTGTTAFVGESTTNGGARPPGTGCGGGTGTSTLYYTVAIPPGVGVAVAVASSFDVVLMAQTACSAEGCSASADSVFAGVERLSLSNTTDAELTRVVAVRPYGAAGSGTFSIDFTYAPLCGNGVLDAGEACDDGNVVGGDGCTACAVDAGYVCGGAPSVCAMPAANGTCAGATPITADASFTAIPIVAGGPRPTGSGCGGGTGGPTLYYEVTIPAAHQVVANVPSRTFDAVVMQQTSCAEEGCSAQSDSPERLTMVNTGDAPITRIFAVRPYGTTLGTFDLTFTFTPLCGNGVSNPGEACDDGNTVDGDGCTACTIDSGYNCASMPSVCAPIAANSTCAGATAITADASFTAVPMVGGGARPSGTGCGSGTGGPTHYYAVAIPPGQEVVANVPSRTADVVVMEQASCAEAGCTAQSDTPERLTLMNTGDAPVTRIFAVRPFGAAVGTFDLTFTYRPICGNGTVNAGEACDDGNTVDGDGCTACAIDSGYLCFGAPSVCSLPAGNGTCESAAAVISRTPVTGDTRFGGARPTATGCGAASSSTADTLYYAVTVPAGESRNVTVTPSAGWDPVLFVLNACDSASCSAAVDAGGSGAVERLLLDNSTGSDAVVRVVGVRPFSGAGGAFTLLAAPPPYNAASITGACVDMSAATAAPVTIADDEVSTSVALPFPFSYFGTPVTHYRVSTNGWLQVATSAAFSGDSAFTNQAIPSTSAPNGVIAPFWDDLRPLGTAAITTLVSGADGSRMLVVEWSRWRPSSSGGEDLTFQAVLHEGSNAIELHYCSLTNSGSGTLHQGSSATIGLENLDGTAAVRSSYNAVGVAATGVGLRYTPN